MDLNIRCDTIKLLEEKLGSALPFRGSGKDFVNWTPIKQNKTITTKQFFFIFTAKETGIKRRSHPWNSKKSLTAVHQRGD